MIIRHFIPKDLPQVLELCKEVRNHHIDILNGYFTEQNDYYEQMGFNDSLNGEKMIALVAEENDVIYGYILAERKFAPHLVAPKVMHICNFGVSKTSQGLGIGKKLMDEIIKICQQENFDEISLGVYNQNTTAYKFYEKYGFTPIEQKMHLIPKKQ